MLGLLAVPEPKALLGVRCVPSSFSSPFPPPLPEGGVPCWGNEEEADTAAAARTVRVALRFPTGYGQCPISCFPGTVYALRDRPRGRRHRARFASPMITFREPLSFAGEMHPYHVIVRQGGSFPGEMRATHPRGGSRGGIVPFTLVE
jgi:hypothetical protein